MSEIIHTDSGWSYRSSQENGDNVDCRGCGNALDDDYPIVNDNKGFAYHHYCHPTSAHNDDRKEHCDQHQPNAL